MNLDYLRSLFLKPSKTKERHYALQNVHCDHIAVASSSRTEILQAHTRARLQHLHAWRVRLYVTGEDTKSTCSNCVTDIKTIAPGRRKQYSADLTKAAA